MATTSQHTSFQSTTQSQLISCSNTWTIENFSFTYEKIRLPGLEDSQKNYFNITLDKDEIRKDGSGHLCVSIFSTVAPYVKLYILDQYGKKCFEVEKSPSAFIQYTNIHKMNYLEFISLKELLGRSKIYLPDDKLTFVCEIRYTVYQETNIIGGWMASMESAAQMKALEDMNQLFTTGMHADVTFLVGEQQLPAHKGILSARSPVFAAMFAHKEMLENKVEIKDVDVDAFKAMLAFIYSSKVPSLEQKLAEDLLAAADKYQVEQLKKICENSLCDNLTIELAPNCLLLADAVNSAKLKEKCLEFIGSRSGEMIQAMLREPNQLVDMFRIMAQKNESKNTGDE